MNEAFLHFIWKFQKFDSSNLTTSDGDVLQVFYPGIHNHDSGPDFSGARVKMGEIEWNGQVEIHLRSSDWNHHGHTGNPAYENVILHVVWQNDSLVSRKEGTLIPALELQHLVDPALLSNYKTFLNQPQQILCANHLTKIHDLTWHSNLDAMLTRRLQLKSEWILEKAHTLYYDWEEVAYITLARNFGFSLNAESFEHLALNLPLKILTKHADQPAQIEALVFGQAGFLEDQLHRYPVALKTEFAFLSKKYGLTNGLHRVQWKFGKMRPSNFPSVRLAQFATLLSTHQKLFSLFREVANLNELKKSLTLSLPDYWKAHYDFEKPLKRGSNQLGKSTLENLIINSVVPLLAAYSLHTDQPAMMTKAIQFLEDLPAESNRHTRHFEEVGKAPNNAFDSQALITLFKDFCSRKKCLNCAVGSSLFRK